jgi:hypothetical protein
MLPRAYLAPIEEQIDSVRRHHYQAPSGRGVDACWRPGGPNKSGPPERALLKAWSRLVPAEALPLVRELVPPLVRAEVPPLALAPWERAPVARPSAQAPAGVAVAELASVQALALAPPALRLWSVRPYART